VRAADGSGELTVPAYKLFSSTEILGPMALEQMLSELSTRRYGVGLEPVALMIDGAGFGEHLCIVVLGIGIDATLHPLGLVEGSTENTSVVTELLAGSREGGLDTSRPILVGIDGAKALRAGIIKVFDHLVIQRCQLHKLRNVADKLPDHLAATAGEEDAGRLPRAVCDHRRGPTRGAGHGA
jgi:hypothetical protein